MQRAENSIPAGRRLMERVFELMPIIIGISEGRYVTWPSFLYQLSDEKSIRANSTFRLVRQFFLTDMFYTQMLANLQLKLLWLNLLSWNP